MDSARLLPNKTRLEKHFRAAEALAAHSNNVTIWKFIGFLFVGTLCGSLHFSVEIQCNVAQLFFHITYDFALCCRRERITTLCEDFHQVLSEVSARKVKS